ncbi:hypothetical protein MASR1M32_04130 [Rhodobacter sp.]
MTMDRDRMRRLQAMAGLVFDTRAQALRRANDAREALLRQIADLDAQPAEEGLVWPAAEVARFGYQQWAAVRRAEINQRLAAQTVVCLQAADETRRAFGRVQTLEKLVDGQRKSRV